MATYSNVSNQIAALKELYKNPMDYMKDLVYQKNPLLALIPKDESIDGLAGKQLAGFKSGKIGEPCDGNTEES